MSLGIDTEIVRNTNQNQEETQESRIGIKCFSCGLEIWFSEDYKTPFNKKIPLEFEFDSEGNPKFHTCLEGKRNKLRCYLCHESISFSDEKLSKSGRKIPLCEDGSKPHDCPESPWNKARRRNQSKIVFSTGGLSEQTHKTLEEKLAEFIRKEEEFRRQWR